MRLAVLIVFVCNCAAQTAPIIFDNISARSGITFRMNNSASASRHQVETMIAGVAMLDYNNDGLLDIYFVNGAALPALEKTDPKYFNALYRNNGDSTWTDVTVQAGVRGEGFGMGVAAADYDNDGWTDIYLAGVNRNQLMRNNGDGSFTDVTARAAVAGIHPQLGKTWAISAGWFDYDNDGFLDLLVVNYVNWDVRKEPQCSVGTIRAYCSPNSYTGQPNMLYHNNGDGTFSDVSVKSGLNQYVGKGMGAAFADYDGDGFTDIFISNDTQRNFLFHNNRNGTFTETGILWGVAYNENGKSIAGMGTDFRDVDNDGKPDIFVVGMVGDTFPLFLNRARDFLDVTGVSGVARASASLTAWGSGIFDFDNDGWKDLFASCASILDNSVEVDHLPAELPNLMLRNLGNAKFANVSAQAGTAFTTPGRHRGAAFGDLNNDGRIDIVVVTQNAPPEILINLSTPANHWLLIKLIGSKSNRDGLGARVTLTPKGGKPLHNHATTSVGYSSSSDRRLHFGLGSASVAETIEIIWPSGVRRVLRDVAADKILEVTEPR